MSSKNWTVFALLVSIALPSYAIRRAPEPLAKLLADDVLVVHATVESAESAWVDDEWGRHIWTTYNLRVARTLKGDAKTDVVSLRVLGGTVGETQELVFDVPRPHLHQEAVFIFDTREPDGPLALERSLPVVAGEVQLGAESVSLDVFGEALGQLVDGNPALLQSIMPPPRVSVRALSSGDGRTLTRELPDPGSAPPASSKTGPTAYFYDAAWVDGIDVDGDGYYREATLGWDADVSDGSSTLTVYYHVFARPVGSDDWGDPIVEAGPHTITGWSSTDVFGVTIIGDGSPGVYDFALAVFQSGADSYDHALFPEDDSDLAAFPLEGADNDVVGPAPTITSVSPESAPAGTGERVTIAGSGFGSARGEVQFLFQQDLDTLEIDRVSADIVSWTDTRIVCEVPICRFWLGECGGYAGGSSSGPMWVITAAGRESSPRAFEVPFGYGGQKWDTAHVNYRISTVVPTDFRAAIERAFATWAAASGVEFSYSGSTSGSVTSQNGITEITYGPMPDGVPSTTIAFALCWPTAGMVIDECDILFNSAMEWSTSSTTPDEAFDVESLALHEFGHWLVLLDLYGWDPSYPRDIAKVMFGWSTPGPDFTKRELHPDDRIGAQWIYPAGPSCSYSISPTSASYGASGGSGSISVSTQSGCTWTATANNSWINISSGASGTGNATVSYSVNANGSSSSRTGTITAAGRTFTVTQSGTTSCAYSISPTSQSFGAAGGAGTVSVNTTAGCTWTASSSRAWIHVTSGSSGTGSGSVDYSVDANAGTARTGTMTIAGRTLTVSQSGAPPGGGDTTYRVAGIAHATGVGGSVWRSTLSVTNRSGSSANLTLKFRYGAGTVTRTYILQPDYIKEWTDVVLSLFGLSGNKAGAIEVSSDVPVMVAARTYSESPEGTFGQYLPGVGSGEQLSRGQVGIIPQVKTTDDFRCNIGFVNLDTSSATVRVKLYSDSGHQLGSSMTTTVARGEWKQINDAFGEAGVSYCEVGYATVEVVSSEGSVWAYGSVVDNRTGDPTTIPMFVEHP